MCWGSCPAETNACGVLCLLPGETCTGTVFKITKGVVSTGVKAAGQDYFGAVKGALGVAADLIYPICRTMNGIDEDLLDYDQDRFYNQYGMDEDLLDYDQDYFYEQYGFDREFMDEDHHRFYDQYFLQ